MATMKIAVRNVLLSLGSYTAWFSLGVLLSIPFSVVTNRFTYHGDLEYVVLMPLAVQAPFALVGGTIGAVLVWLAESRRPARWTLVPAVLFVVSDFLGWGGDFVYREPTFFDRMSQVVHAPFPALTCIAVGVLMERRWRRNARNTTEPPAGRSFEG